jgi:hypothetical protein
VVVSGKTLEIIGTKIHNVTSYPSGLTIRQQDKHVLDLYFTNGLRLKIDQHRSGLIVQLDPSLISEESVSGLCGDYNQRQGDDLKLISTGELTSVPVDFGNQWKLDRQVER